MRPAARFRPREGTLLLGLLLAVAGFVFRDYLLLHKTYLFTDIGTDSISFTYPRLVHLIDYLRAEGIPGWSFNQGMGQNLLGSGTGDVFLPIFYGFGRANLPYLLAYVEVLKILLAGGFFFLYLRTLGLSRIACVTGGLLFGFSGYLILGSGWYVFSYEAMGCALLLWAFERLYQRGAWGLFAVAIALLGAIQPFHLYLYGILILGYATIRQLERGPWSLKAHAALLAKLAGGFLLGMALSAVFLFPSVLQMLQSPRVSGDASFFRSLAAEGVFWRASGLEYASVALRLFSNDLQGTGSGFQGWQNYLESPMLYCGLPILLLVPQFFLSLDARRRTLFLSLSAVCLAAIVFPYLRYLFWGFTGNYFRTFSFFLALVLLFFGLRALSTLDQTGRLNRPLLFASAVVLVAVPFLAGKFTYVRADLRLVISGLLLLYALLLATLPSRKFGRVARVLLLVVVCVEAGYLSAITVNQRPVFTRAAWSERIGYNDHTLEAVRYLDALNDGFYRIHKDYSSGDTWRDPNLNDAQVQRYYGTSSYHSFNQHNYIRFLQGVGIVRPGSESDSRWAVGLSNRPLLEALSSVKYGLTKRSDSYFQQTGDLERAAFGDVRVFENGAFLPLGFGFDRFVLTSDFSRLTTAQKDRILLKAVVIDTSQLDRFKRLRRLEPAEFAGGELSTDLSARRASALALGEHGQNRIRGTIAVSTPQLLFFSIPFDAGWSARVDGQPVRLERVDFGLMGIPLEPGQHDIELWFRPPFLTAGVMTSSLAWLGFLLTVLVQRRRRARIAVRP